jgi:hypothetical protein
MQWERRGVLSSMLLAPLLLNTDMAEASIIKKGMVVRTPIRTCEEERNEQNVPINACFSQRLMNKQLQLTVICSATRLWVVLKWGKLLSSILTRQFLPVIPTTNNIAKNKERITSYS